MLVQARTRPLLLWTVVCVALGCTAHSGSHPAQPPSPPPSASGPEESSRTSGTASVASAIESTVLVTTKWGHGTGVFVEASGLVLTNYHVIASGRTEDFLLEAEVTTAKLDDDGSVKVGKTFVGRAVKVDEKRDLAVLRLSDPGQTFPIVAVSAKSPQPGASVSAIGNAGVGFGWAVKHCSVNAIGTLESFATAIFALQQKGRTEEEAAKLEEEVAAASKDKGKQIQTDCNVLPGDSGGPLLDDETGALVGLNASIRPATSGFGTIGSAAFHIHVDEIRDFLDKVPAEASPVLPDPWVIAGKEGRYIDLNNDGEIDTLRFEGLCEGMLRCSASLTDLDQNSFASSDSVPSVAEIYDDRKFDAEIAVLVVGRLPREPTTQLPVSDLMVFANTTGKNGYNRLLVYDGESYKTRGYAISKTGEAKRDPELDGFKIENVAQLYKNKRLQARAKVFVASITGERAASKNPDRMRALEANFRDGSGDGKYDTLEVRTRVDSRVLVDLNQDQLQKVSNRVSRAVSKSLEGSEGRSGSHQENVDQRVLDKLQKGKLHGEFMAVLGAPLQVYYDTDSNGAYDLLLEGDSIERGIAFSASHLDAEGRRTPAPEHVGRKLLRPGLIVDKTQQAVLEQVFARSFAAAPRAGLDDAMSSFPVFDAGRVNAAMEIDGTDRALVSVLDNESISVLADLDRSSFKGGKAAAGSTVTFVREGKFEAEFVYRQSGSLAWTFYDGNNDGRFERVQISAPGDFLNVGSAFILDKTGAVTSETVAPGAKMLQPEFFKNKATRAVFEKTVLRSVDTRR